MTDTKKDPAIETKFYFQRTRYPHHGITVDIYHKDLSPTAYAEYARLLNKLDKLYLENSK